MVRPSYLFTGAILALGLFAGSGTVAAAESQVPAADTQSSNKFDAEQSERLQRGLALATGGNPRAAISEYYDPVIASYEAMYTDSHWRYFSARSLAEALLYTVQGANAHAATKVVSRNWTESHFLKGYALVDLHELDAARVELEAALKLAPHNSQVLAELGGVYNQQKNFTKALEAYQLAEEDSAYSPPEAKNIDRARACRAQGYAYVELRQWDDAERMYRQSLALDKNDQHSQQEIKYIQQQRSGQGANPVR